MTNLSAATPTPPERPHLWMLAGRLFVAELILGGLILLFGLVGMLTGLFQRGTIVGTTHRLFGWPYLANGFWSMSADVILIATLAAIGSWIVVGALRERGFEVAIGLVFVALLAGPTGLPELLFVGRQRLLISFLVALAFLFVASRVRTPRWNPSRRLKKVLAAVWMLAVVCSLSYGVLHPFDSNMASGARSTTRPDGEQWELPRHGLSIETLFIHNSGFLEATLIGVEAPLNNQRLKSVLVGHWEPWFGPKNAVWPDGLPQEFIKTPFRRLALPAHKTRAITVVFQPGRCRHVGDLAPVRSVRLRYRLGSMTLTQPFQLADPLALCDLARAT
jgi:hypothetical protein